MTASAAPGGARTRPLSALPLLACTQCGHAFTPTVEEIARLGATGCPRCQGWTWLVSTAAAEAPVAVPVPMPRGRDEENGDD
jgi:predicted  nucleic acid-binding Zn-ribbon protein